MALDSRFVLTEEDYRRAQILFDEEAKLVRENMFLGAVYCLLSATENYKKQMKVYEGLAREKLNSPEKMLEQKEKTKKIVSKIRYPNTKQRTLLKLAETWMNWDVPQRILDICEINSGPEKEFEVREDIIKEKVGLGYKCSSLYLRMCGFKHTVPLDMWALRLLMANGYEIRAPDNPEKYKARRLKFNDSNKVNWSKKKEPAISRKEYLQYEQWFSELAKKEGVSPTLLQGAIYVKHSFWQSAKQMELLPKHI